MWKLESRKNQGREDAERVGVTTARDDGGGGGVPHESLALSDLLCLALSPKMEG